MYTRLQAEFEARVDVLLTELFGGHKDDTRPTQHSLLP